VISISNFGRIFFGAAIAGMGVTTIYFHDYPYMLLPPGYLHRAGLIYAIGIVLALAGAIIISGKKMKPVSLILAALFIAIFCFCYVPYELIVSKNYLSLGEWENAEKELAFAGGALIIFGVRPLARLGTVIYSLIIINFGILHFLFAKEASTLIPEWIPFHMFWMYFAGVALMASGIAIICKVKTGLAALLLGAMIFTWFIILHIPRVIAATVADRPDEITSAFLALAYSGIAWMTAGKK
jgi:uncharacterized membrane protein